MTLDDYFTGHDESRGIFEALRQTIVALGPGEISRHEKPGGIPPAQDLCLGLDAGHVSSW